MAEDKVVELCCDLTRIEGTDPGRDALLLHGHLDVVPFDAGDWRHPTALGGSGRRVRLGGAGPWT